MARRQRLEEKQLMRLRQWATVTTEQKANTIKDKKRRLKEEEKQLMRLTEWATSEESASIIKDRKTVTVSTNLPPTKKVEPMEREKIHISRLGWNRDLSSVRKNRCRTDTNLMSAAFLSKYYFPSYLYF